LDSGENAAEHICTGTATAYASEGPTHMLGYTVVGPSYHNITRNRSGGGSPPANFKQISNVPLTLF